MKRWLDRWVSNGVLKVEKPVPIEGQRKPAPSYTLTPTPSRALSIPKGLLSVRSSDSLQEQEIATDTSSGASELVHCSAPDHSVPKSNGQQPDPDEFVHCNFSVPEGDLEEQFATDTPTLLKEGAYTHHGVSGVTGNSAS